MRNFLQILTFLSLVLLACHTQAAPGDPIYETCPEVADSGDVRCYPIHFIAKTEVHPSGLPIVAYLFVPKTLPGGEALPALVLAHGSGSMYSNGNHNKGLNTKHKQWVRQFTAERGIPTLHVDSFQSRYYLLADTPGDQRMFDWENPPAADSMGGDDYRATSTAGGQEDGDTYVNVPFDPDADDWKDQSNGRAGISEIIERPYDMDAAYDYLVGIISGTTRPNARGETLASTFTAGVTQKINDLVPGLVIDPERVFALGTSHGGQTLMGLAHKPRVTAASNPMGNHPRYAGYFDFYGGCGLYGAYGGTSSSTWLPAGPFIMLHGELDDIWTDGGGATSREKWDNGECAPRIEAARANPDLNVLLENVLMKDAAHSFSGAEQGDGNDWYAKVHTDYEIVLPLMDAIGWITWARRSGAASVPNLADLGFTGSNTAFTTLPLSPSLPPYNRHVSASNNGELDVADLRAFSIDLNTVFAERTEEGALTYTLLANDKAGEIDLTGSTLELKLADASISGLSGGDVFERATLQIVNSKGGFSLATFDVVYDSGNAGTLKFLQGTRVRANGTHTTASSGGELNVNLHGIFGTDYVRSPSHALTFVERSGFDGGLALDFKGKLTGPVPTLPKTLRVGVFADGHMPVFDLTLTAGETAGLVNLSVSLVSIGTVAPVTPEVDLPEYSDIAVTPGTPSSGPLTLDGSDSGWNHEPPGDDDGSGGDGDGDGDGNGDGNGGDGSGDTGSGDDGIGSGGGGGGGALAWLLPALLLPKRRR